MIAVIAAGSSFPCPHTGKLIPAECGGVSLITLHLCLETRSGTRPWIATCALRIPPSRGPAIAWSLPVCQLVAGSDRSTPLGSSHSKGAVCGSRGKPPCWHRQSKRGVPLEAAMPALPCSARFGLPPPVLRPGRAGKLILSMTQRGYFSDSDLCCSPCPSQPIKHCLVEQAHPK